MVHHSATNEGNARSFDDYHTKMGYGGLAYHFVIGNGHGSKDGELETGFRWTKQMAGTHSTVHSWYYNIPLDHVIGHKDVQHGDIDWDADSLTNMPIPGKFEKDTCPGKAFPWKELRDRLK